MPALEYQLQGLGGQTASISLVGLLNFLICLSCKVMRALKTMAFQLKRSHCCKHRRLRWKYEEGVEQP